MRCFEAVDGLLAVTSLLKGRETGREVKMRTVEFLYFYLMPETPQGVNGDGMNGGLQRRPSKKLNGGVLPAHSREAETRTTEEKQALLGRHLSNVEDLVEDLRESAVFGAKLV